jgi:hypothetical protein
VQSPVVHRLVTVQFKTQQPLEGTARRQGCQGMQGECEGLPNWTAVCLQAKSSSDRGSAAQAHSQPHSTPGWAALLLLVANSSSSSSSHRTC